VRLALGQADNNRLHVASSAPVHRVRPRGAYWRGAWLRRIDDQASGCRRCRSSVTWWLARAVRVDGLVTMPPDWWTKARPDQRSVMPQRTSGAPGHWRGRHRPVPGPTSPLAMAQCAVLTLRALAQRSRQIAVSAGDSQPQAAVADCMRSPHCGPCVTASGYLTVIGVESAGGGGQQTGDGPVGPYHRDRGAQVTVPGLQLASEQEARRAADRTIATGSSCLR
jgi:hypothetical protein